MMASSLLILRRSLSSKNWTPLTHCINQVRTFDHEHAFCGFLICQQFPSSPSKTVSLSSSSTGSSSSTESSSSSATQSSSSSSSSSPSSSSPSSSHSCSFQPSSPLSGSLSFPKFPFDQNRTRPLYWGIRALNVETALACEPSNSKSTPYSVNALDPDPEHIGGIARLLWWKNAFDTLYKTRDGAPPGRARKTANNNSAPQSPNDPNQSSHRKEEGGPVELGEILAQPIMRILSDGITKERVFSKTWFMRHLESRFQSISGANQLATIREFETLCEHSHSSLLYLALESMGFQGHPDAEHAASHVGKALGIASILRALPHHWQQRRLFLPLEVCQHYGLVPEKVFQTYGKKEAGAVHPGMMPEAREVVYQMACHANEHIKHARPLISQLPAQLIPAFLPVLIVEKILEKLLAVQFDVFHPKLARRAPFLPLAMWKAAKFARL